MPRIKNNEYVNKNSLKEFINRDKEERKKKLTPEKEQKRLDLHYKREIEQVERIENGYYCDDCTGGICTFYQTCKRKFLSNLQKKKCWKSSITHFKK